MNIPFSTLRNNIIAIEKYKDRKIKVFRELSNVWINKSSYSINKKDAYIFTVSEFLEFAKNFPESYELCIYFQDEIGEEKMAISEYDAESIYSCSTVTFDDNISRKYSSENKS